MIAHISQLTVLTTGVGAVMIRLGLSRGVLHFRKVPRRCPSCGRLIDREVCGACTRNTR